MIGHEISHGFDDQGRKFDATGTLRDWWTAEDAKRFVAASDKLGEAVRRLRGAARLHVNGELTMGENIADLGGLLVALDAYHASLKRQAGAGDRRPHRRPAASSCACAQVLARQEPRRRPARSRWRPIPIRRAGSA